MRFLRCCDKGEYTFTEDLVGEDIPPYAILSHTWGADNEEVTFDDMRTGASKNKPGYQKIQFCGEQARRDGLQHFWIDTCCIDKSNKAEISRSITSMFEWYYNAARCYVYLSDVPSPLSDSNDEGRLQAYKSPHNSNTLIYKWSIPIWNWLLFVITLVFRSYQSATRQPVSSSGHARVAVDLSSQCDLEQWKSRFLRSRWFTRGWTLQELLAPASVEFFSVDGKSLGNKTSLKEQISQATNIPHPALSGEPLSSFGKTELLKWTQSRETKQPEDQAYSLQGLFGVYILPIYGEGKKAAFDRLLKEYEKTQECIRDLNSTDPRKDKVRIEDTKGGLLRDSYCWIFDDAQFEQWRNDPQNRLLWIKGDAGKGKTMLLCGIIDELKKSTTNSLSFFFCQGTDSRINSATAVLRALIYLLINQQPLLASHLRKEYDQKGSCNFGDANAWVSLSKIFKDLVLDQHLKTTYVVIDALDECISDLPKLLDLIIATSLSSNRVKWLLSSRKDVRVEAKLQSIHAQARLSLELKQNAGQVSRAVDIYIDNRLSRLLSNEDDDVRNKVRDTLRQKANGTFLWVALVLQELEDPEKLDPLQIVEEAPTGLDQLYDRMVEKVQELSQRNSNICRLLLSIVTVAHRPLSLAEVGSLCRLQGQELKKIEKIVAMCGSFLTVRNDQVYLIHQSAKDYLSDERRATVFQAQSQAHDYIFSRSLEIMSGVLRRNLYDIHAPSISIDEVKVPAKDPLETARYSCIHWVDHLCTVLLSKSTRCNESLQDGGPVHAFLSKQYIYWLEALSLCKSMPAGVLSMTKLERLLQGEVDAVALSQLIHDAHRFIVYHAWVIQSYPLQAYTSALLFSPTQSLIRQFFKREEPRSIRATPDMDSIWSACLQTLEGHSRAVISVVLSHDYTKLASASNDCTIKLWDAANGECVQTLKGHSLTVSSVVFSHDSTKLASASWDMTTKLWDAGGECVQTLKGHSSAVSSVVFSHDSTKLASASYDKTIKLWDATSGECVETLEGHSSAVISVVFLHDSTKLASASNDCTIKLWDATSGECVKTLKGHSLTVSSVVFSHDSTKLASASNDCTIKLWDATNGECVKTLKGHSSTVSSVVFSHDSTKLASASWDKTIKLWDATNGECVKTLKGHSSTVTSVVFSHNSTKLASASWDKTTKLWDASGECAQTLKGHSSAVSSVVFSHDSTKLASASYDKTIKLWDAINGECVQTLKGYSSAVSLVVFSHDSTKLASASYDKTIKLWDATSGECVQTLEGHSEDVSSVVFSHDSTKLASASYDKTIKLWDATSSECVKTLEGHSRAVNSVVLSHDYTKLASASDDKTIKLWDAASGLCIQTLKGHSDAANSVAFSHDSTKLASASRDDTIKLWNTTNGECLETLSIGAELSFLYFDFTDSCLHTVIGVVKIPTLSDRSSRPFPSEPQHPQYLGLGLSPDFTWITYNSENRIWLPPEYRPYCAAVSGDTLVIGTSTGRVCTWKFSL